MSGLNETLPGEEAGPGGSARRDMVMRMKTHAGVCLGVFGQSLENNNIK